MSYYEKIHYLWIMPLWFSAPSIISNQQLIIQYMYIVIMTIALFLSLAPEDAAEMYHRLILLRMILVRWRRRRGEGYSWLRQRGVVAAAVSHSSPSDLAQPRDSVPNSLIYPLHLPLLLRSQVR